MTMVLRDNGLEKNGQASLKLFTLCRLYLNAVLARKKNKNNKDSAYVVISSYYLNRSIYSSACIMPSC